MSGPKKVTRTTMERSHRAIQKLMEGHRFENIEEVNKFLEENVMGRRLDDYAPPAAGPRERAQELAYDAMDAESRDEALRLTREALELDPDNVDALLTRLLYSGKTNEEQVLELRAIVAAGERSLGPEFMAENKGHFWGMMETRPYMRARAELAEVLRTFDRHVEAIAEYEAILELNPNDNLGMREPLLGLYLATGQLDAARRLVERFEGDVAAGMAWGAVLLHVIAGDRGKAIAAFRKARKRNRHFISLAMGRRSLPEPSDSYRLGSEDEAAYALFALSEAVAKHPEAIHWIDQMNRKLV